MSLLFMDGFEHYGLGAAGRANMLDGVYAQLDTSVFPAAPSFGARTGTVSLKLTATTAVSGNQWRRVLPSAKDTLFAAAAIYVEALPSGSDSHQVFNWRTGANGVIAYLRLNADGSMDFVASGGSVLATTSGPVISTGGWNYIETKILRDASAGAFDLRVNEIAQITATSLALGADSIAILGGLITSEPQAATSIWYDDLIVFDDSGTVNNAFLGDLSVATLYPNEDTAASGWAANFRKKFNSGILNIADNDSGVLINHDTSLDIGANDFTLEGFVRFDTLPGNGEIATIFSHWDDTVTSGRAWQLYKGGPDIDAGNLVFAASTDGTAGTVTKHISYDWEPRRFIWYYVVIQRSGSDLSLYIDGRLVAEATDATTYASPTTDLAIGVETDGNLAEDNTGFVGWFDEVRWTLGAARYAGQTIAVPSSSFPRDSADPEWANVVLLAGFDGSITDESTAARTLFARGSAVSQTPDDGADKFETVNQSVPRDDTFIEAAFLFATGFLNMAGNAADTETVTVGSQTYTYVASLSGAADEVLVGADITESLDNLVAAINAGAGEGTVYGTGTTQNASASALRSLTDQMKLTAKTQGVAGNSVATTETLASGSFENATLTGGQDIPGPIEFGLESLPPETTSVIGVSMVTRQRKTDAGSVQTQVSFVGSGGSAANGADRPVTTASTYYQDIVEIDPDTSAGFTVSSLQDALIRINRTV